jgi:hypothetical protein
MNKRGGWQNGGDVRRSPATRFWIPGHGWRISEYLYQKRLERLAICRIVQQRQTELCVAVAYMRELCVVTDRTPMALELAVEVRRPHGVDGSAVNMPDFSVPVIRLRVDMEQGSGEHPYGCPTQDHQPKP